MVEDATYTYDNYKRTTCICWEMKTYAECGRKHEKKNKKKINQPPHPDDHTMATTSAYFNQHSRLKIKDNEFRNKQKQQNKTKTHIGATS